MKLSGVGLVVTPPRNELAWPIEGAVVESPLFKRELGVELALEPELELRSKTRLDLGLSGADSVLSYEGVCLKVRMLNVSDTG